MPTGVPLRKPGDAVRPHEAHQPPGAEPSEKAVPRVAVRPVRQKDRPVLAHTPVNGDLSLGNRRGLNGPGRRGGMRRGLRTALPNRRAHHHPELGRLLGPNVARGDGAGKRQRKAQDARPEPSPAREYPLVFPNRLCYRHFSTVPVLIPKHKQSAPRGGAHEKTQALFPDVARPARAGRRAGAASRGRYALRRRSAAQAGVRGPGNAGPHGNLHRLGAADAHLEGRLRRDAHRGKAAVRAAFGRGAGTSDHARSRRAPARSGAARTHRAARRPTTARRTSRSRLRQPPGSRARRRTAAQGTGAARKQLYRARAKGDGYAQIRLRNLLETNRQALEKLTPQQ